MINAPRSHTLQKLPLILALSAASLAMQQASAHGYIEFPKSRAYMCQNIDKEHPAQNSNCGSIANEPQSIEYTPSFDSYPSNSQACQGDFTHCGPADGKIASGAIPSFSPLDEQTVTRWTKTSIKPGPQKFTWYYTAGHATSYWQFYITKKDWNPNAPLTRDSFDLKPLLDQNQASYPTKPISGQRTEHTVTIPSDRNGYHVILATWKTADTTATFYQVVDVNIDNNAVAPSIWTNVGTVSPAPLNIGDKVKTRVFSPTDEHKNKSITLNISDANLAKADVWPHELAQKVNNANQGYMMGLVNGKDEVLPNYGPNDILVKKGSDIVYVKVDTIKATQPGELTISGLQPEYLIKNGKATIQFDAIAKGGDYTVKATVFNDKNESVAYEQAPPGNTPHFTMTLEGQKPGTFTLAVVASDKDNKLLQESSTFKLREENSGGNGQYDHVFPEGLSSYTANTIVLQPKDGNRYQCKPFPYSGYCVQWNSSANAFEPGVGHSWEMAWDRL